MIRRWLRTYRRTRWGKRSVRAAWRRIRGRKSGHGSRFSVACMLAAGVLAGTAAIGGVPAFPEGQGFRLVSRDQSCHVEWVESPDMEGGTSGIYGIRICPERMEVEFYHKTEELIPNSKK